jgi:hypothetical protein
VSELDLERFTRVCGMMGSIHAGEAENARREAQSMLVKAGKTWAEVLAPFGELQIAIAENNALKDEIEQLRSVGGVVATWDDVASPFSAARGQALWALDLFVHQRVGLTQSEIQFLKTIVRWSGRLTAPQQSRLRHILDRIVERTGHRPPPA